MLVSEVDYEGGVSWVLEGGAYRATEENLDKCSSEWKQKETRTVSGRRLEGS